MEEVPAADTLAAFGFMNQASPSEEVDSPKEEVPVQEKEEVPVQEVAEVEEK